MKIALIHMRHAKTGGTELFLNQLSSYLAEQGEDVTIICRSHVAPSHPKINFIKLNPLSIGKAHRMWRFAKAVEKHLSEHNYDFVYGLGKTWSHDMLRIGGGTHQHFLKQLKKEKLSLKDKIALKIEKKSMSKGAFSHIVANSHKSAFEISDAYDVDSKDISVIHNAVDTNRFDREKLLQVSSTIRESLNIPANAPVCLFLGSGYKRKGLDRLLYAFSLIPQDSHLIIIGSDSNQAKYERLAKDLNIYKRCHFIGRQEKPEHYYSLSDCYILPTRYEPFGYSVIEALSCKCPVITTVECGAKEVLTSEVSQILEPNFKDEELAQAITFWLNRKNDSKIRMKCRTQAKKLSIDSIMKQNYQTIKNIHHNLLKSQK